MVVLNSDFGSDWRAINNNWCVNVSFAFAELKHTSFASVFVQHQNEFSASCWSFWKLDHDVHVFTSNNWSICYRSRGNNLAVFNSMNNNETVSSSCYRRNSDHITRNSNGICAQ